MKKCDFCGGNTSSGCGPRSDEQAHYSKIDCAEILQAERDRLLEALKAIEWQMDPLLGGRWCALCEQSENDGHTNTCMIGAALQGQKCPECGLGEHGKDALCALHYQEYLGTNRARGNGPGD